MRWVVGTRVVMMEQGGTASVRYLTRTVSPFARQTVPEYIEDRIKEDSVQSLDEAARLAVGNDPLLERIAAARAARNERLESNRRILVSLRLTSC
jgi:methionine salvage enolase-phosphatase E1